MINSHHRLLVGKPCPGCGEAITIYEACDNECDSCGFREIFDDDDSCDGVQEWLDDDE